MATETSIAYRDRKLFINSDGSITIRDTPFKTKVDKTNTPTEYYGFANPGTTTSSSYWKILRKSVVGSVESFEFADGDSGFNKVWDNRATYDYETD